MTYTFYAPEPGAFDVDEANRLIGAKVLGLDTEYTGGGLYTIGARGRLVQFATLDSMIVLDMSDLSQWRYARDVLKSNRTFVCHNGTGAEIPACYRIFGVDISRKIIDTMVLALLAWPGEFSEHGLKYFAASKHMEDGAELVKLEEELYQEFRKLWKAHTGTLVGKRADIMTFGFTNINSRNPVYLKYAGLDALIVRRLLPMLLLRLKNLGIPSGTIDFEQEVNGIAARMSLRGMQIDMGRREEILSDVGVRHEAAKRHYSDITGGQNARSPERWKLLAELGVKFKVFNKPKQDGTRTPKLGHEELRELAFEFPFPEVITLLEVAETMNATTFLTALEKHTDASHRLHPNIRTLGAVSGRWQASQPGVQTVSNKSGARKVFIPWGEDYVKTHADLGQIEPRVAFTLAGEKDMIELMQQGADAYSAAANLIFGSSYTPFQRKLTKRIILGTLFAAGIETLVFQAKYTDGWAEATAEPIAAARKQFKKANPRVTLLAQWLQQQPDVRLPSGRYAPHDPKRLYRAINSLVQGSARDALMVRLVDLSRGGMDDFLVMTYHDEIELMLPRRGFDDSVQFVREVMEQGYQGTPTPTDIEVYSDNWGEPPRLLTSV
jgi:DNA polymerase-1